jgi:all-trans-8'-apo-beta-carotenal 15,15'-oxygenase
MARIEVAPSASQPATLPLVGAVPSSQPGWRGAFQDLPREHGFEPLRVEGRLPEDLQGTLYRNGPSLFSAQGRPYLHWFDGDGAVNAVRFSRGSAQGAARVVQSQGLVEERRAGRPLYGMYGTPTPGSWLKRVGIRRVKNVANTSVIQWNGRLLALMEGAGPTELSPEDLSTLGETDLDGVVVQTFSAHPHRVPQRKASYNFGVRLGRQTLLDLYELPDTGKARLMGTLTLAGATMIHDFIATPNHLIFFAPPLRLRALRMLAGLGSYAENLEWKPSEGTEVLVVPIDNPQQVRRFTVEPFYQWHFSNAFERGGELVVDYVRLEDFRSNVFLGEVLRGDTSEGWQGRYHRAVVDLAQGTFKSEPRWDVPCEFPRVGSSVLGESHRYTYMACYLEAKRGLFDGLVKLDLETGRATRVSLGENTWPSEPVFVRRLGSQAEDDGYLLALVYDGRSHTSHVAVVDARNIEAGPVARAHFDHHVPFTFHGNFVRTVE